MRPTLAIRLPAPIPARHRQQLHWIDEAVQPDHTYHYTVALVGGAPALPILCDSCYLTLRTAPATSGDMTLIFNRGTTYPFRTCRLD